MVDYLFVNKLSPEFLDRGGAELRLFHVGRVLAARGHTVSVLCPKTVPGLPDFRQFHGMDLHYIGVIPNHLLPRLDNAHYVAQSLFYAVAPFHVLSFLRHNTVDLIRDSMSPLPGLGLLAIGNPFLRVPAVLVLHQLYDHLGHWRQYFGLVGGLTGYAFQELLKRKRLVYHRVICDAHWVMSYLQPYLGDRVAHLPNGVEYSRFQVRRPRRSASGPVVTLLNVGRFVPQKGHQFLLHALHLLRCHGAAVRLILAGDGPLLLPMKKLSRELGLEEDIEFLGQVPASHIPSLFASADIFVLPSLIEGMPNSVLEAMAAGLPIVASDIPAVREVLHSQNSILVEPANDQALAEGTQRLIADDRMRERLGNCNRDKIQRLYDWDRIADQEIAIYESVLDG